MANPFNVGSELYDTDVELYEEKFNGIKFMRYVIISFLLFIHRSIDLYGLIMCF